MAVGGAGEAVDDGGGGCSSGGLVLVTTIVVGVAVFGIARYAAGVGATVIVFVFTHTAERDGLCDLVAAITAEDGEGGVEGCRVGEGGRGGRG